MSRLAFGCVLLTLSLAPALMLAEPQTGGKGNKYAFLVGCSKYLKTEFRELPYTGNDVNGFRDALVQTGFPGEHVIVLHDDAKQRRYIPEKARILKELDLLLDGIRQREQDTLVVALSGHGLQFKGDPVSYFVPLDGKVDDKSTLIALGGKDGLYELLKNCKAKQKLLIVNACRNDPTIGLDFATKKVLLADEDRNEVPEGIAAIYSCQAGQKSYYDPDRKLALFFDHVIRAWKGEYDDGGEVTLEKFFEHVTVKTNIDANRTLEVKQTPSVQREYAGKWVIAAAAAEAPKEKSKLANKPPAVIGKEFKNSIGMQLVRISAGTFMMGSPPGEEGRFDNEGQHEVEITQDYYLGACEVTIGQFRRFVDASGFKTEAEKDGEGGWGYDKAAEKFEGRKPKYTWRFTGFEQTDEHPVVNVTWNDAKAFCKWLGGQEGKDYGLPTEAQWEYACRAGTKTRYATGDREGSLKGFANVADLSLKAFPGANPDWKYVDFDDGYATTAPVGKFKKNGFGLFDMHGNVWEWCEDWFDSKYYANSPRKDPEGPESGKSRVLRGGSWYVDPRLCRSAFRVGLVPGHRDNVLGFRVVLRQPPRTR